MHFDCGSSVHLEISAEQSDLVVSVCQVRALSVAVGYWSYRPIAQVTDEAVQAGLADVVGGAETSSSAAAAAPDVGGM